MGRYALPFKRKDMEKDGLSLPYKHLELKMPSNGILSRYNNYGYFYYTAIDITKKDIINLCKRLGSLEEYKDLCSFEPEEPSEGGIVYKFFNKETGVSKIKCVMCRGRKRDKVCESCCGLPIVEGWYKRIRFNLGCCFNYSRVHSWPCGKWEENVDDVVIPKGIVMLTTLRCDCGAPEFTREELVLINKIFSEFGIVRVFKSM